jgi:hypothetical protein
MAMNRAQFKKELQMGLNAIFGLEYKRHPERWRDYLDVESETKKAYVEDVMLAGFGAAPVKQEGVGVMYDSTSEVYTARYVFETIALAFAITEEAEEDSLYGSIGSRLSKALARSMAHTAAVKGANILNNGFDTNFPGGDAKPLFSTSHLTSGGQAANMLTTAADLSETSLEDMLILISNMTDHKGIPIALQPVKLVIPTQLQFVARRILFSDGRVDSANNDLNAVKDMGLLQNGLTMDERLTDSDAWFIKTDATDGLKHITRKAISRGIEGDFESGNMRYKARERYVNGWSDWRGAFGTAGGG